MAVVPVVHRSGAARAALRRGLSRRALRLLSCSDLERVHAVLRREVVEAVVVDVRAGLADATFRLIAAYPGIPVFAFSTFQPDDGTLLMACRRAGVRGVVVEGVDEAAAGEVIAARGASRRRRAALEDAPALLRLTERLQLRVWDEVLLRAGTPTRTTDLAAAVGVSREHLSREFGAGGAPNLKRVIDLARICCAADLLTNPGYDVSTVSRILRYASPSHLAQGARRIAGVVPAELPLLGLRQILLRFVRGRTRSRVWSTAGTA
ncbi:MAG: helix-turn-helix domain-containing protein [Gemmatimonadetes bacterium]|nr:helix-turn-helix domain-containing protein [Gemmatimonadota bacterium]